MLSGLLLINTSMLLTLVLCCSISRSKLPLKSSKQIGLLDAGRTVDHGLQAHLGQGENRSMETTNVVQRITVITKIRGMQMDSTGLSTQRLLANCALISQ